jgi:hypothetical protein
MTDTLDHMEKMLADAYRKEVDQTEHIWRSLPFFATTLALQFATVSQTLGHLPTHGSGPWLDSIGCMVIICLSSLVTIGLLGFSILSVGITYIAPEPEILTYADALDAMGASASNSGQLAIANPLNTLKRYLASSMPGLLTPTGSNIIDGLCCGHLPDWRC